ncbi:MAG: glutamate mutase L [Spirochaetes bacterium]|nr:glutamate mutase L [Spirochaetota bacterium]
MHEELVSIDIGSTYTKGALFIRSEEGLHCVRRSITPTTQEDLSKGFGKVYTQLTGLPYEGEHRKDTRKAKETPRIRFSSSAKGGLRIAAVGLVPDLTLQIARLAAWSAGGKVVADSSYKLRSEQLASILKTSPDILLFTGGTDGGNEETVLWNAKQLASSPFQGTILYAGNAAIRGEILRILEGKRIVVAPNVMPRVGEIRIDETRQAIQRIFLDTIVEGKGLKHVQEFCGTEPVPTPAAVFDLVEAIGIHQEGWDRFCVIDLGGATTDVYSVGEAFWGEEGVVLKGIREPRVKRTVEGDLGIRVSATTLWETVQPFFPFLVRCIWNNSMTKGLPGLDTSTGTESTVFKEIPTEEEIHQYVEKVTLDTSYLPDSEREKKIDQFLVLSAVTIATLRHAGVLEETYTPAGRIFLQSGKDLRPVKAIIGSGGYLSLFDLGEPLRNLFHQVTMGVQESRERDEEGSLVHRGFSTSPRIHLVPKHPAYYRDASYIFPLLGNYAKEYPKEVSRLAIETLVPESRLELNQEVG